MAENYDASGEIEPSVCRTGCKTQDHLSYADCLRDGNLHIGNLK